MQNIILKAHSKNKQGSCYQQLGQMHDQHIKQTGLELEMHTWTKGLVMSLELVHVIQGGVDYWEQVCVKDEKNISNIVNRKENFVCY